MDIYTCMPTYRASSRARRCETCRLELAWPHLPGVVGRTESVRGKNAERSSSLVPLMRTRINFGIKFQVIFFVFFCFFFFTNDTSAIDISTIRLFVDARKFSSARLGALLDFSVPLILILRVYALHLRASMTSTLISPIENFLPSTSRPGCTNSTEIYRT